MKYQGLFVGLTTLDCIYLSDRYPQANEKMVAKDYLTAAGGPATNAAVAFSYFGNQGKLLTVLGRHPISQLIKSDLSRCGIELIDLIPHKPDSPPLSSITVTATTGERYVISINALKSQGKRSQIPQDILAGIDIVLVDGHQIDVSMAIVEIAYQKQIPVVMDGGSWKPGLEKILPKIDYAICSANFYPPGCQDSKGVFDFLRAQGIDCIAITQGNQAVQYCDRHEIAEIAIPKIEVVDTLGAGDIFHGAFCNFILHQDFHHALACAAKIASNSCQYFGTRSWLDK